MLQVLEDHYGQKPIIYATEKSYALYLAEDYEKYDIWIRNVITKPELTDHRRWTFWQYTNREKLSGYHGKEKYIDMNVFNGNVQVFHEYIAARGYRHKD
jgi:lysozyme